TVENADWTQLSATIATGTSNGYANNFTPSGNVDLSAYTGQIVHIGFRYTGSSNGITTTYQVDNVTVTDGGGGVDPDPDPDPDPNPDAILFQNFETVATGPNENINLSGWTNVNVSGGSRRYEGREFSSNKFAQVTAFSSGESPMEAWLVTPGVSLDGVSNPKLTFLTKDGFNNGDGLKVYVSTNYNGDPSNASWTELSATIASGTASGYAPDFTPSGTIDLSTYSGQTIHIVFKYIGADDGISTTYQIDDIHIFDE
ncbi:MAG TPA: choice-of-anchor J domain-containing protein, partial [Flavobacteriaceae bacterium]|nr:choice-of-anchor J domain-containing protein [Flavobacteriaceae bacterium]